MKIKWEKCPCGSPACRYWQPVGLGSFYQGTGFTAEERDEIDRAFDAENGVRDLDEVVHELGIEDSETTPAEAVRELKAEIERRDETIRRLREAERDLINLAFKVLGAAAERPSPEVTKAVALAAGVVWSRMRGEEEQS